jgi:hypothetical protein
MYLIGRSDTGQYVVTDPATKTVMVGDDLPALFDRMAAACGEGGAAFEPASVTPPAPSPRRASVVPWVAMALLPFVWLGALHVSLGRLVTEVRLGKPAGEDQAVVDLRARLDRVERQLDQRGGKKPGKAAPAAPEGDLEPPVDTKAPAPKADPAPDAEADAKPDAKAPAVRADAKAEPDAKDDAEDARDD